MSASDSVRLSITSNIYLTSDSYYSAHIFIRVCINKHGRTSIRTNLCSNVILIRVLVFIWAALWVMTNFSTCCIDVDNTNLRINISIYNFLRLLDFCIPNSERSELRVPISDFRISERLDLQTFGLWFLDF